MPDPWTWDSTFGRGTCFTVREAQGWAQDRWSRYILYRPEAAVRIECCVVEIPVSTPRSERRVVIFQDAAHALNHRDHSVMLCPQSEEYTGPGTEGQKQEGSHLPSLAVIHWGLSASVSDSLGSAKL